MDVYHKQGANFRFKFVYTDPVTNLRTSGLTLGSFTYELIKNETGGQSTADWTLTEAAASSGDYHLVSSGSTGFAAATGVYGIVLYRTADSAATRAYYTATVRVTADGTASGSLGNGSFTATANDGRVMVSGTPFQGATVRITNVLTPSITVAQTTSGATGLWGPVFFDTDGTYTITVQNSGYSIATGTITVSGLVATGPGADLTMVSTGSSSGITFSELKGYARRMYRDRTGTKSDTEVGEIVNEAVWLLCTTHQWPKYQTFGRLAFIASYNTGTISIPAASAVVTLVGGVFPANAASSDLIVNGRIMPVLTRDSDTQVTLKSTWEETAVAAGTSYVIAQSKYTLPSDLLRIDQMMWGPDWPYGNEPVSPGQVEYLRDIWQVGQTSGRAWAVMDDKFSFWPYTTVNRMINMLYYRRAETLTNDADIADWDALKVDGLRRAIDYCVAIRGDCVAGTKKECYDTLQLWLADNKPQDKTQMDREYVSPMSSGYGGLDPIFRNTVSG